MYLPATLASVKELTGRTIHRITEKYNFKKAIKQHHLGIASLE